MYLWTIQRKEVIETLIKNGEYYPDIEKSKGYGNMKIAYPQLLESFNNLNNSSYKGIIFGFYGVNGGKTFETIEELYNYLYNNEDVAVAFNFWNSDFVILHIKVEDNINIMPMEFNDVIKLGIDKSNDIEGVLHLYKNPIDFKLDICNIIKYMNEGRCNPHTLLKSFIEGHCPYLNIENIMGVYPNFDSEASRREQNIKLCNLSDESNKLKELIYKY